MTKFIAIDELNNNRDAQPLFNMNVNNSNYLIFYIDRDGNNSNIFALKEDNNNYINISKQEKQLIKEIISSYIKNEYTPNITKATISSSLLFDVKQDYIATTNNGKIDLIKIKEPLTLNLQEDIVQRVNEENDTLLIVDYDYREAMKKCFSDKTDLNDLDAIFDKINKNLNQDKNSDLSYSYGFINYNILGLISIVSFVISLLFLAYEIKLFK